LNDKAAGALLKKQDVSAFTICTDGGARPLKDSDFT
jgi:hypothetical protein